MRIVTFVGGVAVGAAVAPLLGRRRKRRGNEIGRSARSWAERPEVQQVAGVVAVQAGALARAARQTVRGSRPEVVGAGSRLSTVPPSFAPTHVAEA